MRIVEGASAGKGDETMQDMKKEANGNINEASKQKERHIVSWSKEEDDLLREQIRIHGTENWTIIASKFKDKSTRQCRRRWYTYLNSDFKKGGWSPEEDMLLCEAQRIFGNRWTEIAKVVSGRTDNAVKNRFSTLCKKRAKDEALAKENVTSLSNMNNQSTYQTPVNKSRRRHVFDETEICSEEHGRLNLPLRPPLTELVQNFQSVDRLQAQHHAKSKGTENDDAGHRKIRGTFLKKDDPKIFALMQQAELLSSLALKVNSDNTNETLEKAWKIENFKDLVKTLRNITEGNQPLQRDHASYEESPGSSEHSSTGSTGQYGRKQDIREELPPNQVGYQYGSCERNATTTSQEFNSPLQVTPLFRALAAGIPTPKFSESEKHFLLKTLGVESRSTVPATNPSEPPPCKRSLLQSL